VLSNISPITLLVYATDAKILLGVVFVGTTCGAWGV